MNYVREEFGSKTVKRKDLQRVVEEQWTEVSLVLNCSVDSQGQTISVQSI